MELAQEIFVSNYNMFFAFFSKVDPNINIEIICENFWISNQLNH